MVAGADSIDDMALFAARRDGPNLRPRRLVAIAWPGPVSVTRCALPPSARADLEGKLGAIDDELVHVNRAVDEPLEPTAAHSRVLAPGSATVGLTAMAICRLVGVGSTCSDESVGCAQA